MAHNEVVPPALRRPEKSLDKSSSGSTTPLSASLMPTERQTISGVDVLRASNNLGSNYPNMTQARIYHPRQAPSAVLSENFLQARAGLNPGMVHNVAQTNIARLSNLYRDVPQFKNTLDILA